MVKQTGGAVAVIRGVREEELRAEAGSVVRIALTGLSDLAGVLRRRFGHHMQAMCAPIYCCYGGPQCTKRDISLRSTRCIAATTHDLHLWHFCRDALCCAGEQGRCAQLG